MKYIQSGVMVVIALSLAFTTSCKKTNSTNDLSAEDKKLLDSLDKAYKPEEVNYVYFDSIPVYKDKTEKELVAYLPFCTKVFIDTIADPMPDKEVYFFAELTAVKGGKLIHGFTKQNNLAKTFSVSKKDSSVLFMANYLPPKGDFCSVEIKVIKDRKLVSSYIPDDSVSVGYWLDMHMMDSIQLKNTGEVIFLSTYYPACGYGTDDWYLNYTNGEFTILSHTRNFADAPYWDHTTVYFPAKTKEGNKMVTFMFNAMVRDTNNNIVTYGLPPEFEKDWGKIIYEESSRSAEVLDKNGQPVMDEEYDEPVLGEEIYSRKWYSWDGKKITILKTDTNVVKGM